MSMVIATAQQVQDLFACTAGPFLIEAVKKMRHGFRVDIIRTTTYGKQDTINAFVRRPLSSSWHQISPYLGIRVWHDPHQRLCKPLYHFTRHESIAWR